MFKFFLKNKKTVFDIFSDDIKSLPDDSFATDKINSTNEKTHFIKLCLENKYLGIFSFLTIITFKDQPGKNYIFKCDPYEFDKYELPDLIKKMVEKLGKDDDGNELYTRKDANEIDDNLWLGRSWTIDSKESCALTYDEDDGLFFTIWT